MERMRLKYDVKRVFVDGNDVCLFYDLKMSGTTILVSAWYQVQDGKIHSLKVVFDPETRFGNRLHTVATAETKGCAQALRRAADWQPRCRLC
jgi:uncharacterized protein (DUF2147 family)